MVEASLPFSGGFKLPYKLELLLAVEMAVLKVIVTNVFAEYATAGLQVFYDRLYILYVEFRLSIRSSAFKVCAGDSYLVPGATVATLLMLGALHARRLYDDKKVSIIQSIRW